MPIERINSSTTPPKERDEAQTPADIYWWVSEIFGPFDVDLAATARNALCPKFLTKEDDALTEVWAAHGDRGWCNPPYSNPGPWIDKAVRFLSKPYGPVDPLLWYVETAWIANQYRALVLPI